MMIKKIILHLLAGSFFLLFAFSCNRNKEAKVTITKDYVINPNWDKIDNSFDIIRMKLKENNDTINLNRVSPSELLQKLEEDTSFVYHANVLFNGTEYSERYIYFNRDNGFLWWGNLYKSNSTKKVLGELQKNTWYLLTGLSNVKTLYYLYIDTHDNLYSFKVSASHWTNY